MGFLKERFRALKYDWKATQKIAYLFLAPWVIGIVFFSIVPMLMSLSFSFTNYDMFNTNDFIGLDNYRKMFADPRFARAVSVTVQYVLVGVPLQLAFALFLAVKLSDNVPGARIFRSVYYIPSLLGGSVAIAFLWRQIFGMDGLLNKFLAFLGVTGAEGFSWINEPSTAVYTLVILLVWQFGSCMVIFVAGIKNIPQSLYEAAEIDGASRFRLFWNVTFPMLTPIIFFNLLMQIISAFQAFTPSFIIGKGTGGFRDSILFYTLYLYLQGFKEFKMGYASALAWLLLIIIGLIAIILFATSRFWVHYDD
jgi:multiple sugar transport system permease protein